MDHGDKQKRILIVKIHSFQISCEYRFWDIIEHTQSIVSQLVMGELIIIPITYLCYAANLRCRCIVLRYASEKLQFS